MNYDSTYDAIEELPKSLLSRNQARLETSMRFNDFIFHYVYLLHCKCHKINFKRGGSYTNFPDWIESKKAAINLSNTNNNKYFHYATTVALNHERIKNVLQRISVFKPFISKYE